MCGVCVVWCGAVVWRGRVASGVPLLLRGAPVRLTLPRPIVEAPTCFGGGPYLFGDAPSIRGEGAWLDPGPYLVDGLHELSGLSFVLSLSLNDTCIPVGIGDCDVQFVAVFLCHAADDCAYWPE